MIENRNHPSDEATHETDKTKTENTISDSKHETRSGGYSDTEKDLSSKILKMTMMIREEFPELAKYLEEMPVSVPNDEYPTVKMDELKKHYDSLRELLNKYRLEHPHRKQL